MIKESDGGNTVMGIASWSPWHTDLARLFLLWDCWEDRKLLWTTLVPLWPALELVSTAEREEKPEERRGAVGICEVGDVGRSKRISRHTAAGKDKWIPDRLSVI